MQTVKEGVMDHMLDHVTGRPEESKENRDMSRYQKPGSLQGGRFGAKQQFGGGQGGLEDIKEDSESQQESQAIGYSDSHAYRGSQ